MVNTKLVVENKVVCFWHDERTKGIKREKNTRKEEEKGK